MNGEADALPGVGIEIGMRGREGLRFGERRLAKTVDIVVAVALGVGDADEGTEREILLHGKARLTGEVLAGHEEPFAARAPLRRARRVDDGLVQPLAGLRGNAAIAQRPRRRERIVGIVSFIDDEAMRSQRAERRLPRDVARHRLLDIEQARGDRPQCEIMIEPVHQRAQHGKIGVLLVGVERHLGVAPERIQLLADPHQPRRIGHRIARQLQLEVICPGVFMGIGNTALAVDGIIEADGMPDGNTGQRLAAGE